MEKEILVSEVKGRLVTTSRNVAEVFEKRHKNVLRDIEILGCSGKFRELNFEPSSYISKQKKKTPEYLMKKRNPPPLGGG